MKDYSKKALLIMALGALTLTGCKSKPDSGSDSVSLGVESTSTTPTPSDSSSSAPSSDVVSPSENSSSVDPTPVTEKANGLYPYSWYDYEKKTEILGTLEKYAVENNLTGLTLYERGGYSLYNPRIVKGTNNYITGYGFGVLSEGSITSDLATESNTAWKRYYHTFEQSDPGHINYMNDKGSVVSDLIGYHQGSYWEIKMNDTKDGYEWYSSLAKNKPQAVDADEHDQAKTWKFYVNTGDDGLVYNTLSTKFSKYAGRAVTLEDYITPYKIFYTQATGYARSADTLSGASSISGTAEYYAASKNGFNQDAWDKVGIKSGTDSKGSYLQFTFNVATNSFYAMYYLASSMFAPVPQEFIDEIGGTKVWEAFDTAKGLTPVDTSLSTGPYVLESWQNDKQIVFKKNDKWLEKDSGRYQIAGVHINILPALGSDNEAALKEFEAGRIDACGVPATRLDDYKSDPRAVKTKTGETDKLNFNTCSQERWEELFGENGTIKQTKKEDYWECEPAMSNSSFLKGLSYAFDRQNYADLLGKTPSIDWLGSLYLSDPENGVSYSTTEAHKNAIASLTKGAESTYGYNLEIARAYFKQAATELLASGAYKAGDTIEIQIAWQTESNFEVYGDPLKSYFETAFNDPSVCDNKLTLKIDHWAGSEWSDVYYKKMMVGQFDIGFGGISGNALNPLNFLEVLKSDNSSTFTLNWGVDTSVADGSIVYDGKVWSFDALWQAGDSAAYVVDGQVVPTYGANFVEDTPITVNTDGSATLKFAADMVNIEGVETSIAAVVIWNNEAATSAEYFEDKVEFVVGDDGVVTVTVSADLFAKYKGLEVISLDVYFDCSIAGITSSPYVSIYTLNPAFTAA